LTSPAARNHPANGLTFGEQSDTLARWLNESSKVLVGAGAGLSVAAGIDYTDERDFATHFPALVQRGFRARYQLIGYDGLEEPAFWGYWASHVQQIRFAPRHSTVYQQLFDLLREKDYFVLTSNVDAMFVRHGFDGARVCSIQGDYANIQCMTPCRQVVWHSRPDVERLVAATDPVTQQITDPGLIPRCCHCGGNMFLNVRAGRWFVDAPYLPALRHLNEWVRSAADARTLVLDIGSGFNTPSVVRWPMERVVAQLLNARLARVNPVHSEVPSELGARALAIGYGAGEIIAAVHESVTRPGN
jgi:NAD-dependent SIR2 family protein deacetylase